MVLSLVFFGLLFCAVENGAAVDDAFAPLKQKLVKDGFEKNQVSALYPPGFTPLYKTVSQTLRLRESKLNYDQFLQPSTVAEAKRFLHRNESILLRAEESYGVSRCVIVAILLVETHFGSYTGTTPTLAILSTFALMEQKSSRDRVWTMAMIHERLYRSPDPTRIDMRGFLTDLAGLLVESLHFSSAALDLQYRLEDVSLPLDQAIPCALIVNELITNAFKHGPEASGMKTPLT